MRHTAADDIPADVLHESTRCLLDHLGLAIAGAEEPAARIAREQCRLLGGEPQARVLGTGHRLRVTDAALVNGIACHALDFDDTHVPTILHPTTPLYAAGMALAEWRGSRGIDLLAAHALGYELAARASNALYPEHYDVGWHMTGTTGALASAAVAIRLLDLTGVGRDALPQHRGDSGRRSSRAVRHHDQTVARRPGGSGGCLGGAARGRRDSPAHPIRCRDAGECSP